MHVQLVHLNSHKCHDLRYILTDSNTSGELYSFAGVVSTTNLQS